MAMKIRARIILHRISQLRNYLSIEDRTFRRVWPNIDSIEGFMVAGQERWLFSIARTLPDKGIIVEIGSYKGRSTTSLAYGCMRSKKHVYAIDTFNGNDGDFKIRNFLNDFNENIKRFGLSDYVTPLQGKSSAVAKSWSKPIHFLFIDGSHEYADVLMDFNIFFPYVVSGGIVAFHDVDPRGLVALQDHCWEGPLLVWEQEAKPQLVKTSTCSTIAYGFKP